MTTTTRHGPSGPPPPGADDALDALLREPEPYLPDEGFTARVMSALPPRARASRWRPVILAAAALLACLVAGFALGGLFAPGAASDLGGWLWKALTWSPAELPAALPVAPLVLGGAAVLAGALAWARAT